MMACSKREEDCTPALMVRDLRRRMKAAALVAGAFCAMLAVHIVPVAVASADEAEVEKLVAKHDQWKGNLAPLVIDRGDNLAYTEAADTINPEQTAFARQMGRGIYMPVKDKVYVAVGYGITSMAMVVGDDGIIIIDPGENDKFAAEVMEDFRKITDKPIKAVVYTHRHSDHPFGIKGLGVTDEDVESGRVRIFAHDTFEEYLANDASVVGPILSMRTALASTLLPVGPEGRVHQALGPTFDVGQVSLIEPTDTFDEELEVEIAGVRMVLFHAYGDAEDEIDVWFPDLKHVHGSETIQGETFPNMYTLRGTKYRDPVQWYQGVDNLLKYAKQADRLFRLAYAPMDRQRVHRRPHHQLSGRDPICARPVGAADEPRLHPRGAGRRREVAAPSG